MTVWLSKSILSTQPCSFFNLFLNLCVLGTKTPNQWMFHGILWCWFLCLWLNATCDPKEIPRPLVWMSPWEVYPGRASSTPSICVVAAGGSRFVTDLMPALDSVFKCYFCGHAVTQQAESLNHQYPSLKTEFVNNSHLYLHLQDHISQGFLSVLKTHSFLFKEII